MNEKILNKYKFSIISRPIKVLGKKRLLDISILSKYSLR